jgi:predicted esterase YcpF (UPF0227 family)
MVSMPAANHSVNAKPLSHLLYLHGFRSSPQSHKARIMATYMAQHHSEVHWWCPQLPPSPQAAAKLLQQGVADWPRDSMAIVGSSLGGFYATWLTEQCACPAVLLNPAVNPARDLEKYIGEQTSWHDPQERFFFRPEFVQQLRQLQVPQLTRPQHYLAIIAKGDEVLEWREMQARYALAHIHLLEGGDHALSDFETLLPVVMSFLGLS